MALSNPQSQPPTEAEVEAQSVVGAAPSPGEPKTHALYAITVFGYKKAGMSEEAYHEYISQTHAGHLKALLAREGVVSYTMVSFSFSFIPFPLSFPPIPFSFPYTPSLSPIASPASRNPPCFEHQSNLRGEIVTLDK